MDTGDIKQQEWGSHLPAVLACFAVTEGPVLELGVGHCSTPALHALCGAALRPLVSVEQDRDWHDLFKGKYESPSHQFLCREYDDAVPFLCARQWCVALIDNSPGGERRKRDFEALIQCCEFVVVHDYWKENEEAIAPLLNGLNWHVCKDYEPPTLVASANRSIPQSLI